MVKFCHISDLHFGNNKKGFAIEKMRDGLIKKLREEENLTAIFITGDFRYAPKADETVSGVVEYIEQLAEAAGVKNKDVFIVPGNHDLTRGKMRDALVQAIRQEGGSLYDPDAGEIDGEVLHELKKNFKYFEDIEKELYGKSYMFGSNNIHAVRQAYGLNILMLNTAFTANDENDRLNLIVFEKYVKDSIKLLDKKLPTLMMGHHGMSYINEEEQKRLQRIFREAGIHLYLCGHSHSLWHLSCMDDIHQFTAGCIWKDDNFSEAGFYIGEIEGKDAEMCGYIWDQGREGWTQTAEDPQAVHIEADAGVKVRKKTYEVREEMEGAEHLDDIIAECLKPYSGISPKEYGIDLDGHVLIGSRGKDGIKYYWKRGAERVESIAFNSRLSFPHPDKSRRLEDEMISAYTCSVSVGCALSVTGDQCKFCDTGIIAYKGPLTAEQIALQNIFMATYDSNCTSYPEVRDHKREFAFMGQGEPGYNYSAVKRSILITDLAMEAIGQEIHRYVISTSGICEFMPDLIQDMYDGVYKNRVALHVSLHLNAEDRKELMPIDRKYRHNDFLEMCKEFYRGTKTRYENADKIGVGIMMFKESSFRAEVDTNVEPKKYSLDEEKLKDILSELDKDIFRIDLCDFNPSQTSIPNHVETSNAEAKKFLKIVKDMGFEGKTFSSFGSSQRAGCGMLSSAYEDVLKDGKETLKMYDRSLKLLHYAVNRLAEDEKKKYENMYNRDR